MEAGSEESLDASVELQSAATEEEEVALPEAPDSSEAATVTTLRIDNFRRPFTLNAVKVGSSVCVDMSCALMRCCCWTLTHCGVLARIPNDCGGD